MVWPTAVNDPPRLSYAPRVGRDESVQQSSEQSDSGSPTGTQAIDRALNMLWVLSEVGELSITALAQRTGLTLGTTSRIAKALATAGLIRRNPLTDAYHLGPGAAILGRAAEQALGLDKALPMLQRLGSQTAESVNLVVREGGESVVVMRVESTLPLRFTQEVGARFPLYSTASGKAMLAFTPALEDYLAELPEQLPPVAPGTLATRTQLRRQLEEIREAGFSIDMEENVEGVRCVGAPVLDDNGVARAAVVVQAPAIRMRRPRILELAGLVKVTAQEVGHVLPTRSLAS